MPRHAPLALLRALLIPKAQLAVESLALGQQIAAHERSVPRPRIRAPDRIFWVFLRGLWSGWRGAVGFVQPVTVVAWHREGWRSCGERGRRESRAGRQSRAKSVT
jgi:hypothetical protein